MLHKALCYSAPTYFSSLIRYHFFFYSSVFVDNLEARFWAFSFMFPFLFITSLCPIFLAHNYFLKLCCSWIYLVIIQ